MNETKLQTLVNVFAIGLFIIVALFAAWTVSERSKTGDAFCEPKGFESGRVSDMFYPVSSITGINCYEEIQYCVEKEYCRIEIDETYFGLEKQEKP